MTDATPTSGVEKLQAAYLATILPNPAAYHSHWESGVLPAAWVPRLSRFLTLLGERGRFDAIAVDEGTRELASFRFHHEGDPPPPARSFEGGTGALPIGPIEPIEHAWDEALDGEVVDPGEREYE